MSSPRQQDVVPLSLDQVWPTRAEPIGQRPPAAPQTPKPVGPEGFSHEACRPQLRIQSDSDAAELA